MVAGQTGNARLASLVFIKLFNGGMDETEVRHHRLTRAVGVARENGIQYGLMLLRQPGKDGRNEIHALSALLHRRMQNVEEPAHRL